MTRRPEDPRHKAVLCLYFSIWRLAGTI